MSDVIPYDEAKKTFRDKLGPGYVPFDSENVAVSNKAYKAGKLKYADLAAMSGDNIPERRWVINEWVPEGYVHMLSGDGGVGKSLLAQQMMTCAATGMPWMGKPVRQCRTLGIFCEDDGDELQRRQAAINRAMNIDFFDVAENMTWVSRVNEDSNALMEFPNQWDPGQSTVFFQQVHNLCQDFGAELIVLDSLHDLFPGNENSRVQTRQFVKLLTQLAKDCNGAVILDAHPSASGMTSGKGFSGSTAWHNSVRSRAYLTYPEEDDADPNLRILTNKKANYGEKGKKLELMWEDWAFKLVEKPIGVFKGMEDRRVDKLFLDALDKLHANFDAVSHSIRSRSYAPRMMVDLIPKSERIGESDLQRAMRRLIDGGIIRPGTVRFPGGAKPKEGLVRIKAKDAPP